MNNEQLIKSAHIYALVVIVCLVGLPLFASRAESNPAYSAQQNENGNTVASVVVMSQKVIRTKEMLPVIMRTTIWRPPIRRAIRV